MSTHPFWTAPVLRGSVVRVSRPSSGMELWKKWRYRIAKGSIMRTRLLACVCTCSLFFSLPVGASSAPVKVTYLVTGTGRAFVSYRDPGGIVTKTVRLPFKASYEFARGAPVSITAIDDSMSPKATIACAIDRPDVRTVRVSKSGPEGDVDCF